MFLIEATFAGQRECVWLENEDSAIACVRDLLRAHAEVHVCQLGADPANDAEIEDAA